jgi:hypothetical protein
MVRPARGFFMALMEGGARHIDEFYWEEDSSDTI